MAKRPAFMFYTGDWLKDPELGQCSPATRGIWMDLLCSIHEANNGGKISGTPKSLARICRCTENEIRDALTELRGTRTADTEWGDEEMVTITNRRMNAEDVVRRGGAERQRKIRAKGGGDPKRWTAIRVPILERDRHMCAYCGKKALTVDHITPKSRGGTEDPWNLVACCKSCNNKKINRTPEEAGMKFWPSFDKNNIKITSPSSVAVAVAVSDATTTTEKKNTKKREGRKQAKNKSDDDGYTEDFESFWKSYPGRSNNPKFVAFEQWQARLKEGLKPEVLTQACRNYATWCKRDGITGTFIKQARRFVGPKREWEEFAEGVPEAPEQSSPKTRSDLGVEEWRRQHGFNE